MPKTRAKPKKEDERIWKLEGHDRKTGEWYKILGSYPDLQSAVEAALERLDDFGDPESQETYIVNPDGEKKFFFG